MTPMVTRRHWLTGCAATCSLPLIGSGSLAAPATAAPGGAPPVRLLMAMDTAADQQEHARDYAAGLRAVMQGAQRDPAASLRAPQLETLSLDGSAASLQGLASRLRADPDVVALVGCSSERLSLALIEHLSRADLAVPHLAPWLPDTRHDQREDVVTLFASRQQQMAQTLRSLESMGLRQFALVFDGPSTRDLSQSGIQATLGPLHLQPPTWTAPADGAIEALVQRLPADLPPVLVVAGGTLEFARLARALAARGLRRMLVSLNDLDTTLLLQLGAARDQSLVLTQVVPSPSQQNLRCVRHYRELHARLFDDAPSPSGLAGYLAGRYVLHLLARKGAAVSRQGLLEELRRRTDVELDGYSVRFSNGRNRGGQFVTQTMLAPDGRLIG